MPADAPAPYIGRFAPTPSGPLHFGSLLAAAASYLDARKAGGRWLLRIEDIDPPREMPGADRLIIDTLARYGFEWDGEIIYQSRSVAEHHAAAENLRERGLAYPCSCSRKDLSAAPRSVLGIVYPGTCRRGCKAGDTALRVLTNDDPIRFADALQGPQSSRLESESGDFVIVRRDGLVAYQLAVVIDDAAQGITDVVRGVDLLPSTPRQIHLQRLLGLPTPRYAHIPVAENDDGSKLSKLTGAQAIPDDDAPRLLLLALDALGQNPPQTLKRAPIREIWAWAIPNWMPARLAGQSRIALQHYC